MATFSNFGGVTAQDTCGLAHSAGPFLGKNGKWYVFGVYASAISDLVCNYSTAADPTTATFSDIGSHPSSGVSQIDNFDALQDDSGSNTVFHIAFCGNNTVRYVKFDTGTGSHGGFGSVIVVDSGQMQHEYVSIARRPSDGDLLLSYSGPRDKIMGTNYARVYGAWSTDGGATWGNGYLASADAVQYSHFSPHSVVTGNNRIHVFYIATNASWELRVSTYASTDSTTPSSSHVDTGGRLQTSYDHVLGGGIAYDDSGTERVRLAFLDSSATGSVVGFDDVDTPASFTVSARTDNTVWMATNSEALETTWLPLIESGGSEYLFYIRDSDRDVYLDVDNGTDTQEIAGTVAFLSANLYDRSGPKIGLFWQNSSGTWDIDEVSLGAGSLTLASTGLASSLAIGMPSLSVGAAALQPAGHLNGEAFGGVGLSTHYDLAAGGIASAVAFGGQAVAVGAVALGPSGLTNLAAPGVPALSLGVVALVPTAVGSGVVFGAPSLATTTDLQATGLAQTAAFGGHQAVAGTVTLSPSSFTTGSAFGSPALSLGPAVLAPSGLPTTVAFGASSVRPSQVLSGTGLATGATLGMPAATTGGVSLLAVGLAADDSFGATTVTSGAVTLQPSGRPSAAALGQPTLDLRLTASGAASGAAFGGAKLSLVMSALGIPSGIDFGLPSADSATVALHATGLAPVTALGTPNLTPQGVELLPGALASHLGFGVPEIAMPQAHGLAPPWRRSTPGGDNDIPSVPAEGRLATLTAEARRGLVAAGPRSRQPAAENRLAALTAELRRAAPTAETRITATRSS